MMETVLFIGDAKSQFTAHVSRALKDQYDLRVAETKDVIGGAGVKSAVFGNVIIAPESEGAGVLEHLSRGAFLSAESSVVVFGNKAALQAPQCPAHVFWAVDPCGTWKTGSSYVIAHHYSEAPPKVVLKVENLLKSIYNNVHFISDREVFNNAATYCKYMSVIITSLMICVDKIARYRMGDACSDVLSLVVQNVRSTANLLISNGYSSDALNAAVCTPNGITAAFCSSLEKEYISEDLSEILSSLAS